MLVASLRDVIRKQSQEIETLQTQLQQSSKSGNNEVMTPSRSALRTSCLLLPLQDELLAEITSLRAEVAASEEKRKATDNKFAVSEEKRKAAEKKLAASEEKCKETEKEQEDLLVLLDDLSSKRKRDKEKLRAVGQEVSEDEADDDDDDEDED